MKRAAIEPLVIGSIPEFCRLMELPPPEHPHVNVIRLESIMPSRMPSAVVMNFFSIWLKKNCVAEMGLMRFFLPGQVMTGVMEGGVKMEGLWLLMQPELLWNYPVDKNIGQYGFFADAVSEVLRLAGKEERMITAILRDIEQEYLPPTRACCQEAILSHVETLFVYAERFYRRQYPN